MRRLASSERREDSSSPQRERQESRAVAETEISRADDILIVIVVGKAMAPEGLVLRAFSRPIRGKAKISTERRAE